MHFDLLLFPPTPTKQTPAARLAQEAGRGINGEAADENKWCDCDSDRNAPFQSVHRVRWFVFKILISC